MRVEEAVTSNVWLMVRLPLPPRKPPAMVSLGRVKSVSKFRTPLPLVSKVPWLLNTAPA